MKINSGPSGSQIYSFHILDTPPYKLGFFMMTIAINESTISPIVRLFAVIISLIFII